MGFLSGVGALLLLGFVLWILRDLDDVLPAYPSPERHEGVILVIAPGGTVDAPVASGDFDGDGVPDELETEYFHMEPLDRPSSSGMVYVRSGATGEVLFAHAVPTPLTPVSWRRDVDLSGTDDVAIDEGGGIAVYGRTAASR